MTRISDSGLSVAVVGATGQVGTVMREILAERAFPIRELRLFATARSAGTAVEYGGQTVIIEDVAFPVERLAAATAAIVDQVRAAARSLRDGSCTARAKAAVSSRELAAVCR